MTHIQRKKDLTKKLKAELKSSPDNITDRCLSISKTLKVSKDTVRNIITGAIVKDGYLGEAVLEMWRVVK